ncbi:MAG: DUF3501 family protein [Proteobacteria bacterium]|nr:DUF3501 family protein [Pseudomonadota bacterium]
MTARFLRRRAPLEQMLHLLQDDIDQGRVRQRLQAYRRMRTVALGPCMRLQFEDPVTVQHQAYDSLPPPLRRDGAALARALAERRHLLPEGLDWRATLQLGLQDLRRVPRPGLPPVDALQAIHLDVAPGTPAATRVRAELRPGAGAHPLLRFALTPRLAQALLAGAGASLGCNHPAYAWRHLLPPATLKLLRRDLHGSRASAADGWQPAAEPLPLPLGQAA